MTSWVRVVPAVAIALAAGGFVGCGDDDDSGSAGEVFETTTEAETTSTTEATTTTSGPNGKTGDGTTTTIETGAFLPEGPPFQTDGPSGSGCAPGPGALPDGWWYGMLEGPVTDEVTFDLACYYVGDAAEAEAASRGDEVNNDYYVVNENPALRTMPVADDATASCVEMGTGVEQVECAPAEVDGEMWAVWLRVQDGEVDRIVEQYAP